MATGSYWDVSNPDKPFGILGPMEVKHIPFDFAAWLSGESATYAIHTLSASPELLAENVSVTAGVVLVSVRVSGTVQEGGKYSVTVLVTASDGQKKSQTLYFKIKGL